MQLVSPDKHLKNIAERAIQIFKNHFVSILASLDASFPVSSVLVVQTSTTSNILTLNLIRPPNVAPTVSSYAYVHGEFDYNEMPLAPMGCAVQLYGTPHRKNMWAEHSVDGFYVGASKSITDATECGYQKPRMGTRRCC